MELFLYFAVHGIISGLVYLLFIFLRGITNNNLIATIVFDFACGLILGLLFFRANITASVNSFQIQHLVYFLVGFSTTLITFKNFVASTSKYVYNKIRKAIIGFSNKNKGRNENGCTKTATKS